MGALNRTPMMPLVPRTALGNFIGKQRASLGEKSHTLSVKRGSLGIQLGAPLKPPQYDSAL